MSLNESMRKSGFDSAILRSHSIHEPQGAIGLSVSSGCRGGHLSSSFTFLGDVEECLVRKLSYGVPTRRLLIGDDSHDSDDAEMPDDNVEEEEESARTRRFRFDFVAGSMLTTATIFKSCRRKVKSDARAELMQLRSAQRDPVGMETSMFTP